MIKLAMSDKTFKIGIIGGGIVGLSVACILQERYPASLVRLHAEDLLDKTTSWGAAGFCKLKAGEFQDNNWADVLRWLRLGLDHYWEIWRSTDAFAGGVELLSIYELYDSPQTFDEEYRRLFPGFREVSMDELRTVGLDKEEVTYGVWLTSVLVESRYYLPFLTTKFEGGGGEIRHGRVHTDSVADWAAQPQHNYDVVVNCSGLGSRQLFGDQDIRALRGQLVRVKAPWYKCGFITNTDTYAYPARESVVLGGLRQPDDYDTTARPTETADILQRVSQFNHCLAESPVIEEWAGLRPWRPSIRVETENITTTEGDKVIPVVHNYGHGSRGIALSWGTSLDAVNLVTEALESIRMS